MANCANAEHFFGITSLPSEVIHQILEDENLHMRDLLNLAESCKQLYETVNSGNLLWKRKFFQRWPSSLDDFEEQRDAGCLLDVDWQEESQHRIVYRKSILRKISRMASAHGVKSDLPHSAMKEYDRLFLVEHGASPLNYHYLTDMLTFLGQNQRSSQSLEGEPINFKSIINDTLQKHYARLVNKYLRNTHFAKKWRKFLSLPKEQQTMEQGAMFVTRWSQSSKRISSRKVSFMLDEIARKTRKLVADKHPLVPINSVAASEIAKWRNEISYENKWNVKDSRIIFTTLYEAIYEGLGFYGVHPEGSTMHSMFIDHVLKHKYGNPLLLAIVFESVARRLGLYCEIVSCGERFLIRWTEERRISGNEEIKRHYIDILTADRFEDVADFLSSNSIEERSIQHESSVAVVTQRMFAYLKSAAAQINEHYYSFAQPREADRRVLDSAFKLMIQLKPEGSTVIDHLANFYESHDMNSTELVKTLSSVLDMGNHIRVEEEFPTSHSIQILRHITEDLYKKDRITQRKRRIRRKRTFVQSLIPCRCCKRLRAFAETLKRQRKMRARLGRVVTRRR